MRVDLFVVGVAIAVEELGADEVYALFVIETAGVFREADGDVDLFHLVAENVILVQEEDHADLCKPR